MQKEKTLKMERNSYLVDFISINSEKFQNTKSFIISNMAIDIQEKVIAFKLGSHQINVEKLSEEEIEQMVEIGIDYITASASAAISEFIMLAPIEMRLGGIVVEDFQSLLSNYEEQATYELEIFSLIDQTVYVRENVFLGALSGKLDGYVELLDALIAQEYQKKIANIT